MINNTDTYKKLFSEIVEVKKVKEITNKGLEYLAVAQHLFIVSNNLGILRSTPHLLAKTLNVSERKMKTILDTLQEIQFIEYNKDEGLIWVVDMLYYTNIDSNKLAVNKNQLRLFRRYLSEIDNNSTIKMSIYKYYGNDYPFLFTKHIENKEKKITNVEKIESFVKVYNILIKGKDNKAKGYLSKRVKEKIVAIKNKGYSAEILRKYALTEEFIDNYKNISELLDMIEEVIFMEELDANDNNGKVENDNNIPYEDNDVDSKENNEEEGNDDDDDDRPATQEEIANMKRIMMEKMRR